jgi:Transposase domain (DUF772)
LAKTILNLKTTRALIDRLQVDAKLRRLCGFDMRKALPSEATFSRAFAEFAQTSSRGHCNDAKTQRLNRDNAGKRITWAGEAQSRPGLETNQNGQRRTRKKPHESELRGLCIRYEPVWTVSWRGWHTNHSSNVNGSNSSHDLNQKYAPTCAPRQQSS